MSNARMIVLRIQSPEGTKRVEVLPSDTSCKLFEKVHDTFGLGSFGFALYRDGNHKQEIISSKSVHLSECGLQHGDMLYLTPMNGTVLFEQPRAGSSMNSSNIKPQTNDNVQPSTSSQASSSGNSNGASTGGTTVSPQLQEDDVDIELYKADGKIARKRDDKYCRHNSNGCCIHCSPLEPFDGEYLKEQNIKHMSFHSYIRKITSGADQGKFLPLEEISCRIKPGCSNHPPWPRGICSKCQPSAVTLNRQHYRHVDNVMFENTDIVERFLEYWRSTGHQRIGFLIGTYEKHTDVPLGIRARVVAIYEPPQESSRNSVKLLLDDKKSTVDHIARELGLQMVGWIFTDLLSEDSSKGTVQPIRGVNSHFISAQECIMAGNFQNEHPNPCRYAPTGYFGSKFVTVCVTGDQFKQVHMEGYQVSRQCMALVRDDCLLPTRDAPELGYVKESSNKQYVPDVYYKEKDQYGNEVSRIARPLPVEYLLVDVPCAASRIPLATFTRPRPSRNSFPVLGRAPHTLHTLAQYLHQWKDDEFLEAMSDLHVLLYIATMDALPMLPHMENLLQAVRTNDSNLAATWRQSGHWATVEQLIEASDHGSHSEDLIPGAMARLDDGPMWTCPHCTYHNPPHRDTCEICVLPRRSSI